MSTRQGTIVDGTLIAATSSTSTRAKPGCAGSERARKGSQWCFWMKVHLGVDKDSGLIHSVVTTATNVHDLTPAGGLLHGDEEVVYADAGYQGIAKRSEMASRPATLRVAMRPGELGAMTDTPDGWLPDLFETAKAHVRAKGQHPFRLLVVT